MHFGERLRYDAVVRPAAFLSIADQARFLQNAKMERETRLRGIEIVLQVAHALIPAPQLLDDSQPGLIGERVEEPDGSRMIDRRTRHTSNVSTFFGTSMAAGTPSLTTGSACLYNVDTSTMYTCRSHATPASPSG